MDIEEYEIDSDLSEQLHVGYNEEYITHLVDEHECKVGPVVTMEDLVETCRSAGSHFFDPGNMSFFGTTTLDMVWGCRYFLTHEEWGFPTGGGMYVVRSVHLRYGHGIDSGDFEESIEIRTHALFESKREAITLGSILGQGLELGLALVSMGKVPASGDSFRTPAYEEGNSVSL